MTEAETTRAEDVSAMLPVASAMAGADAKFGESGDLPYLASSQDAYATVSTLVPLTCYEQDAFQELLAAEPDHRDPTTDLGCYLGGNQTAWCLQGVNSLCAAWRGCS